MQVFGRLLITFFQHRLSHKLIAHSCFVGIGISIALLYLAHAGMSVAILFALVFGGSFGVVSIIRPVIARDLLGDKNFGVKAGLLAFFYLIGSAISPYFASLLWSLGGYDLMIIILIGLSFCGLFILFSAVRLETT